MQEDQKVKKKPAGGFFFLSTASKVQNSVLIDGGAGSLMAQRETNKTKKEVEKLFLKAPHQWCDIPDESQTVWCVKWLKLQH